MTALYGDPIRMLDGTTVIPVTAAATRFRPERALGVFVVTDDGAAWHSVVDDTRIAQLGITVGLVATFMSLAAVIRRPPWEASTITRLTSNRFASQLQPRLD